MLGTKTNYTKKEEKIRRKKLLRAFREDQQAMVWNRVMDEVASYDLTELDAECDSFDFLDPLIDPDLEDSDEDYPNKAEKFPSGSGLGNHQRSTRWLNDHQLKGGGLPLRLNVASSAEAARNASRLAFSHIQLHLFPRSH